MPSVLQLSLNNIDPGVLNIIGENSSKTMNSKYFRKCSFTPIWT